MKYAENEIKLGELTINPLTLEVKLGEVSIELEPKWVKVLMALAAEPDQVLTRKQIIEQVWSDYMVGEDSLNRAISKLRKSLEPVEELEIKTVRGVGYQLVFEQSPITPENRTSRPIGKIAWASGAIGLFAIIVALLVIGNEDEVPTTTAAPYQSHITSDLGIEYSPDISPNNKFMAYTWNGGKGSQWNIYVKQIGLEGSTRLTDTPGSEQSASWSNAGDKLAFFSYTDNSWSLIIKTFLGTEERVLLEVSSVWKTASAITWSKDDKSLVFSARKQGDKKYTLNRIVLDDLSVTALKVDEQWDYTMPHFSPDHRYIATVAYRGLSQYLKNASDSVTSKLQVLDATTGELIFERRSREEISSIGWKSNASLIFTMDGSSQSRVYQVDLDGDQRGLIDFDKFLPILVIPDVVRSFTYHAPSGDMYLERWRADVNIWKAKYSQGKIIESNRAIGSTLFDFNPKLTPDESQLAYISDKSNIPQIWLHDLQSGASRQITNHKDFINFNTIDWSSDGSKLVLSLNKSKEDSYASIIDTYGNELHKIEKVNGVYRPIWSEDDQSIYAILYDANNSSAIWQYEIASGQWKKFSDTPAVYLRIIDDYLYYIKQNERGLWRSRLDTPEKEELVSRRLPKARADYWEVHGDTLKLINLDFEKSFLEIIHIPSKKLLYSSEIKNYIPYGQPGASFTRSNEVYFSSIDNYDADITRIKLPEGLD